jgi:hypothetical protein
MSDDPYADWPRCPACGDYALDESITCGRPQCDEAKHRRLATGELVTDKPGLLRRLLISAGRLYRSLGARKRAE